jgi:hypothetical protein
MQECNWDSSVGVAGGLQTGHSKVRISEGARYIPVLQNMHVGSGVYADSYLQCTGSVSWE